VPTIHRFAVGAHVAPRDWAALPEWRPSGSANETRAALALACAWGYISEQQATEVDALYDRVLALTYRLWTRA
jgi:hypothetical protein